jgi:hypothetical protein
MAVCGPRMLEETIPFYLLSTFGFASNMFINGGSMISSLLGGILPENDPEAIRNTGLWRVIYAVPWIL